MKALGVLLIVWSGYSILVGNGTLWVWGVLGVAIAMVMDKTTGVGEFLKGRMDYYNSGE